MSDDVQTRLLTAILESVTLLQDQLNDLAKRGDAIEVAVERMHQRLDQIHAGQSAVSDIVPTLESMVERMVADRAIQRECFERTAELAAFAHSAATGNGGPLPDEVADQPLLKRFAFLQPPDRGSKDTALARWEGKAKSADLKELIEVLKAQYAPSPTEFVGVRVLRLRMAAISRAELEARGAALPPARPPAVIRDDSAMSKAARHAELATLWSQGDSLALYGEAELAGAVDYFNRTRSRLASEGSRPR
jgi:hypothetical protein